MKEFTISDAAQVAGVATLRRSPTFGRNLSAMLCLLLWLSATAAHAETINVDAPDGSIDNTDGKCSISEAIENANFGNQGRTDCAAGSDGSLTTINLIVDVVVLNEIIDTTDGANGTPSINSHITIDGNGIPLPATRHIAVI